MENNEQKESIVKKIGRFFCKLDSKVCNVHMRIVKGMLDKENRARAEGRIGKDGFKTVGAFILWLVVFPFHSSKYSTSKYKQAFLRICISAVLALIPLGMVHSFIKQAFPSYIESFQQNILTIWVVMVIVMVLFLIKCGVVLVRLFTCLIILAILMASLTYISNSLEFSPETKSSLFVVIESVIAVFFLLWSFWPKKFKEVPAATDSE